MDGMAAHAEMSGPDNTVDAYRTVSNSGKLGPQENRIHPGPVNLPPTLGTDTTKDAKGILLAPTLNIEVLTMEDLEGIDARNVTIKDICGPPDWIRVDPTHVPERFVVSLRIHKKGSTTVFSGTGALIGPRCILTVGHNVYCTTAGSIEGWAGSIDVYAGRSGAHCFARTTSSNFRSISGWVDGNKEMNDYDIAAIILPDDELYKWAQGHFGVAPIGSNDTVQLLGYPWEKKITSMKGHQLRSYGPTTVKDKILTYRMDSYPGHSGSPVFTSDEDLHIVGVHAGGSCPNESIRINEALMERIKEWTEL